MKTQQQNGQWNGWKSFLGTEYKTKCRSFYNECVTPEIKDAVDWGTVHTVKHYVIKDKKEFERIKKEFKCDESFRGEGGYRIQTYLRNTELNFYSSKAEMKRCGYL